MIKEIVRPFAHNQEELTCPPIRNIFFKPNTDATNKKSIFLDRLNYMRRKETVAHGISGNKEFCENIISQRIPDLELLLQHLFSFKDYLLIKPFEVTIQKGEKSYLNNYYVLKGITSHRNKFPTNNLILSEPLETNKCYLFNPHNQKQFLPLYPLMLFSKRNESGEELFLYDGEERYLSFETGCTLKNQNCKNWLKSNLKLLQQEDTDNEIEREVPFISRTEDMKKLNTCFRNLNSGISNVVFFEGELGIGKTRLVTNFFQSVKGKSIILEGNYERLEFSEGYVIPLKGIRQSIYKFFEIKLSDNEEIIRSKVEHILNRWQGWSKYVDFFVSFLKNTGKTDTSHKADLIDRAEYFHNLAALFFRISEERPFIILLDDIQWADSLSLEFINHLSNCLKSEHSNILLICVYRSEEASYNSYLKKLISILSRYSNDLFSHSTLNPLKKSEIESLITTIIGKCDPSIITYAFEKGEGNPFYTIELIRFLTLKKYIAQSNGEWKLIANNTIELPFSLKNIIESKISFLKEQDCGDDLHSMLEWISVFGNSCAYETLINALSLDYVKNSTKLGETCEELIESLTQMGFLYTKYEDTVEDTLICISSKLLRDIIYSKLYKIRKLSLSKYHLAVASSLEKSCPNNTDEIASILSYHYLTAKKYLKAFEFLLISSRQTMKKACYIEAFNYIEKAEKIFDLKDIKLKLTQDQIFDFYMLLGDINDLIGKYHKSFEYYDKCLNVISDQESCIRKPVVFDRIGQIYTRVGNWNKALDYFQKADKYDRETAEADFVIAHKTSLASAVYVYCLEIEKAISILDNTREAYKTITSRNMGRLLAHLAIFSSEIGCWEKSLSYANNALECFKKLNACVDIALINSTIANVYVEQENYNKAKDYYKESESIFSKFKSDFGTAALLLNKSILFCDLGNIMEAMKCLEKSKELFEMLSNYHGVSQCMIALGNIYFKDVKYEEARKIYLEAKKLQEKHNVVDLRDQSMIENNLGCIAALQKDKEAESHLLASLDNFKKLEDKKRIVLSQLNLAKFRYTNTKQKEGLELFNQAISIDINFSRKNNLDSINDYEYIAFTRPKPNA